jgi:ectoine hydroxylase-related dioxygenase (phytanoyl-CoA dioxygenase family)
MSDLKTQFKSQGYVFLKGFFSQEEAAQTLRDVEEAQPKNASKSSGLSKVGLVFKENIYYQSKPLQAFVSQPKVVDLLKQLIGPDFWIRWDQLISKHPGGVEFPWHQDNGYNKLRNEHYQFWVALSPSNPNNGGLWLIPGSHKKGFLTHRFVGNHEMWEGDDSGEISITAEPGDVVVFSSLMLHRTKASVSGPVRHAYVVEYMSSKHFDPYIDPPYFMVAKGGRPDPKFVNFYQGRLSPANALKYLRPRIGKLRRTHS